MITAYDSGTALTTGETGVTATIMRFNNPLGTIAATSLSDLPPALWTYKNPERFGEGDFVGVCADDVEKMDRPCVTDDHGELKDYRELAHPIMVVQQRQAEIEQPKRAH
jgi:hypothetical protein